MDVSAFGSPDLPKLMNVSAFGSPGHHRLMNVSFSKNDKSFDEQSAPHKENESGFEFAY